MDFKRRGFLSTTAAAAALTIAKPFFGQTKREQTENDVPRSGGAGSATSAPGVPSEVKKIEVINLRELEPAAQKILPPGNFGYISSAAGDEWTKRENEAAFKRMTIEPRYLSANETADMSITLLGRGRHGKGRSCRWNFDYGSIPFEPESGRNREGGAGAQVVSMLSARGSRLGARSLTTREGSKISSRCFDH